MRRRLVAYFARKRCAAAEDLADETLNRVARRLEEKVRITDAPPARYCYIVARFVFLESLRDPAAAIQPAVPDAAIAQPAGDDRKAARLDCLDRCLAQLGSGDRHVILEYYAAGQGSKAEQRRKLAARLGCSANALAIRASRLRNRLEACVSECLGGR